jgi:putative transcriptional regulator
MDGASAHAQCAVFIPHRGRYWCDMPDIPITGKTDRELMQELGARLRALRGDRDIKDVAENVGLDRGTVASAERGQNPTLRTLIRLLRVYGRLGALEAFIPEPPVSPMSLLMQRKRRRGRRTPSSEEGSNG